MSPTDVVDLTAACPSSSATHRGLTDTTPRSPLSPAQRRVIDVLGRRADYLPDTGQALGPDVAVALRESLESGLRAVASLVPDGESLWIGKTPLASHEACPGLWRAQLDDRFSWSIASVRGTVSHKAIELSLNWRGEVEPARVVDAAITRMLDGVGSAGAFLRTLSTVELAELRSASVDMVTAFEECFPPLKARWRPVVDGRLRAELCGGRIVLAGRPDLTLGQASRSGKVIVDLKTGGRRDHHVEDLRFYALVDTLRVGLPPRRMATMYLDTGQPVVEPVTPDLLAAAAERVVLTTTSMAETRWGTMPTELREGRHCAWCPARDACPAAESRRSVAVGPV
jgi:hypothetical protein